MGTLLVENSTIADNRAGAGGGLLNFGTLTVKNSTISGNGASNGGGLLNAGTLTVEHSTVSDNSASDGSGIFNSTGGIMTLTDVTFENNIPNDCTGCPGLL